MVNNLLNEESDIELEEVVENKNVVFADNVKNRNRNRRRKRK
jgi:hypothetical protein